MGIDKIAAKTIGVLAQGGKKAGVVAGKTIGNVVQNGGKKLAASLDCLGANNKAALKKTTGAPKCKAAINETTVTPECKAPAAVKYINNAGKMPDLKELAKDSIVLYDVKPKEAVNAAKEIIHVTGKPVGFSAEESAKTFIDAGKTKAEIKADLMEKYSDKIEAKKLKLQEQEKVNKKMTKKANDLLELDKLLGENK